AGTSRGGAVMRGQQVSLTARQTRHLLKPRSLIVGVLMVVVGVIIFFPIYWMIVSTIQPLKYSLSYSPPLFLKGLDLSPFHAVFLPVEGIQLEMGLWLWNSTQLALMVTVICVLLSP